MIGALVRFYPPPGEGSFAFFVSFLGLVGSVFYILLIWENLPEEAGM